MRSRFRVISPYAAIAVIISVLIIPFSYSQASNADKSTCPSIIEKGAINSSSANDKVLSAGHQLEGVISTLSQGASKYAGEFIPSETILGISILEIIIRIIIFILIVIGERTVSFTLGRQTKNIFSSSRFHTASKIALAARRPVSLFIIFFGAYGCLHPLLQYNKSIYHIAGVTAGIVTAFIIFWFLYRMVDVFESYLRAVADKTESELDDMLVPFLGKIFKILVVIFGTMTVIHSSTGMNLGPMLASLGIGGIAIALAAKDSIANFLGSLTILFDKPFTVGDRIIIDGHTGVVENVGFRSTRIRTAIGYLVSIPNEKVVNTTLVNAGKSPFYKWDANVTLSPDTTPEKISQAIDSIRELFSNHEAMKPETPASIIFSGIKDKGLLIQISACYYSRDSKAFNEWTSRMWSEILKRLKELDIKI
jgi:MscS family membrane protein